METAESKDVVFFVNGERHAVRLEEARRWTLARYLRERTRFTGTKVGCSQGGCGACTVVATNRDCDVSTSTTADYFPLPSCLYPLVECHGRAVRTVEGLVIPAKKGANSSSDNGVVETKVQHQRRVPCCHGEPHPIQHRVAEFHGTQCGFCTPGMIMSMFASLNRNDGGSAFDKHAIEDEDILAGNICRCTGYRPLSDALKSFAKDPYDVNKVDPKDTPVHSKLIARFRPNTLDELIEAFRATTSTTLIVSGHTGHGVYGEDLRSMFRAQSDVLHIRGVKALHKIDVTKKAGKRVSTELRVGAAATIARFIEVLGSYESLKDNCIATALREHASLIGGHQIRNVGSCGGNLMLCRKFGFSSDLATILDGVGAGVEYVKRGIDSVQCKSLHEFLNSHEHDDVLLLAITLSIPHDPNILFSTYRTALRSRNAYPQLNAAFFIKLSDGGEQREEKIVESARIVYGALGNGRRPFLAVKSADALTGKTLRQFASKIVATAKDEVIPLLCQDGGEDGHDAFRGRLVTAFAKKFVAFLSLDGEARKPARSLHAKGTRESQAVQRFDKFEGSRYSPAFQPIRKTSGLAQTTGGIKYTADAFPHGTLFGAYISAPFCGAMYHDLDIGSLDGVPTVIRQAIKESHSKGFIIGYKKIKDAGFRNTLRWGQDFASLGGPAPSLPDGTDPANDEDLFLPPASPSAYDGQPVAIVLCKSQLLAERVAAEITRQIIWSRQASNIGTSATNVESKSSSSVENAYTLETAPSFDARQMGVLINRNGEAAQLEALLADESLLLVEGRFDKRSQQHFYMETQRTLTVPGDDGILTCYPSAQGMNNTHKVVSHMLNKRWSEIVVKLRRVGGAFGGKLSRGVPNAVRSAACAALTQRPVLLAMTRENDMSQVGGREEMAASWRAAVEQKTGKIKAIDIQMTFGAGHTLVDSRFNAGMFGADFDTVYDIKHAQCTTHVKQGFSPPRTAVRTPIHFETAIFMESVLDKIALDLRIGFSEVRERNFVSNGFLKMLGVKPIGRKAMAPAPMLQWSLRPVWDAVKRSADYAGKVASAREFNEKATKNGWPCRRGVGIAPGKYTCYRAIHTGLRVRINILDDGSLQVHSGGAEIGQGLLTKVGQCVCSTLTQELGLSQPLDMDLIRFREFDSAHNPNQGNAGGSTTSEAAVHAAEKACKELAARLKPWKKGSNDWREIIKTAKRGIVGGITSFAFKVDFDVAGFYLPPFDESLYPVFGASVAEVEIDSLTGETKVLSSHVVMDAGISLNPAIDIGQVEGAYVMGLGQLLLEQVLYDEKTGKLKTDNTWTYKPPGINDIPENFTVELLDFERERVSNGFGAVFPCLRRVLKCCGPLKNPTMGAKRYRSNRAMGEPPMMTVTAIGSALRQAIVEARHGDNSFDVPVPCTPEDVSRLCANLNPGGSDWGGTATSDR
eukprot:g932.t1